MIASMELSEGQHSALMTTTWYVVISSFFFLFERGEVTFSSYSPC